MAKNRVVSEGENRSAYNAKQDAGAGLAEYMKDVDYTASPALENIKKAFSGLGEVIKTATFGVVGLGVAIGKFVQLANPALFDQFALVLKDLGAVIGRTLAPVLQLVIIPAIRLLADTLLNLAPIGVAVAKVFESLLPAFESILDLVSEGIQAVAQVVQEAVPYFIAFGRVITDVVRFIIKGVHDLLSLIGIDLGEQAGLKKGSSTGAAVRDVGHSSIEDVVKQAQRASFSLGTASQDPARQTADAAKAMKEQVDKIYQRLNEIPGEVGEWIAELPGEIWEYLKELPGMIGEKLNSGAKAAADFASSSGGKIALRNIPQTAGIMAVVDAATEAGDWYKRNAPDIGLAGLLD